MTVAIPPNAVVIEQQMDPADRVDFIADCYDTSDPENLPLLEADETITSYTVTMSPEGVALGVSIDTVAPRQSALINSSTAVKFWLQVSGAYQGNAAWDGDGTPIPVVVQISTSQNRVRERTMVIQVAQQ